MARAEAEQLREDEDRSSPGLAFDSFQIVVDRNIFDPNRRRQQRGGASMADPPRVQQPPDERIALTGSLIYETANNTEIIAFFEGSKAEYNATIRLGESIAGYRVAEIRTDGVKLETENQQIDLPVGAGLSRQVEGKWQIVSASDLSARRGPESGSPETIQTRPTSSGDSAETKSSEGSTNDVLRKLMERRKQELKR